MRSIPRPTQHPETLDIDQEPAVISKQLSDLILAQDKPADLIALYWFYYYTAKWQGTSQPKAVNKYVAKGLKWTEEKVSKRKRNLIDLGLIENITSYDPATKCVNGHYIKIYFMWSQTREKPGGGDFQGLVNTGVNPKDSNRLNPKDSNRLNTKETNRKKSTKTSSFDPEELPGRFIKYPKVIEAWLEFALHRKKLGHRITERAYKKLMKKILPQSPEAIVSAIDISIENDWRGLFFNDYSINTKGRVRGRPDTDTTLNAGTKLGIDEQLLYNFIVGVLGNSLVSKPKINCLLKDMTDFHTGKIPEGALEHLGWGKFFKDWLLFLEEKESSFPLQSVNQLKIDGLRWNEYIKRCEHYTSYSFKTGKWIGG